jgi:hypothetical protein
MKRGAINNYSGTIAVNWDFTVTPSDGAVHSSYIVQEVYK